MYPTRSTACKKYLILTNHKIYFECMLVGMDSMILLSEEEQKLLTETAQEMVDYARGDG